MRGYIYLGLLACLSSGCGPFVSTISQYEVTGVLLHANTLDPIPNADVRVSIRSSSSTMGINAPYSSKTNEKGEFTLKGEGELVILPEIFLSDEETESRRRDVKVTMSHPLYLEEAYSDQVEIALTDVLKLDVGAFYMEEKE